MYIPAVAAAELQPAGLGDLPREGEGLASDSAHPPAVAHGERDSPLLKELERRGGLRIKKS